MIQKPSGEKSPVEITTFGLEALRLAMAQVVGADPKTVTVEPVQVLTGGEGGPEWAEFRGLRVVVRTSAG